MVSQQEILEKVDFDFWAYQENLLKSEQYLLSKYLDKNGRTLEAGTGGGRILLELQKIGFTSLYGFDCLSKSIEMAKQRDTSNSIVYDVQNTKCLKYNNSSFDNLIYLQQVISYTLEKPQQSKVLGEAYRILKPGGVAIFSFLSLDSRLRSLSYRLFLEYIRLFRKLSKSNLPINCLPSLKTRSKESIKNNYASLLDFGPYLYWFKVEDIYNLFKETSFRIIAAGSNYHTDKGTMCSSLEDLKQDRIEGMIYVVCQK